MCIVKMPRLRGNCIELDRIHIEVEKGESSYSLAVRLAQAIVKKVDPRQFYFHKTDPRRNIEQSLTNYRRVKTWPALDLVIRGNKITISMQRWLSAMKDPRPEEELDFFENVIKAHADAIILPSVIGITIEIESATPEEVQEFINKSTREATNIENIVMLNSSIPNELSSKLKPLSFSFSFSRSCLRLVYQNSLH